MSEIITSPCHLYGMDIFPKFIILYSLATPYFTNIVTFLVFKSREKCTVKFYD